MSTMMAPDSWNVYRPLSSPELAAVFTNWSCRLPDGYRRKINLDAVRWMKQVAR